MKIILDAGHGPDTPGKRSPDDTLREYHFNSAVAYHLKEELEKYDNVETLFVHSGNRDVPLQDRTDKANKWGANVYVSIHANAFGSGGWNEAEGIETYVHTTRPKEAYQLAKLVQENLIKETKRSNRGVKAANFHVLRETIMTSILVECGFMTNKEEANLLKSDKYRKTCASAIVKGLVTMYGLTKKEIEIDIEKADRFATEAQKWVIENSISDGLRPRDPITRQEVWTMLHRLSK